MHVHVDDGWTSLAHQRARLCCCHQQHEVSTESHWSSLPGGLELPNVSRFYCAANMSTERGPREPHVPPATQQPVRDVS